MAVISQLIVAAVASDRRPFEPSVLDQEMSAEPAPSATPPPEPDVLLPDLQTLEPFDLYIQAGANGEREIRFSTTVVNTGEGPLEILGAPDVNTGDTNAIQLVRTRQGDVNQHFAGSFSFDAAHDHWHFQDFTTFELWTYRPDGSLDQLKATTGKITFCLVDTVKAEITKGERATAAFFDCNNEIQGISAGWSDTYEAWLPGQKLDIGGVPNGRYAILTTVDPNNALLETNDTNNHSRIYVEIQGMLIETLEAP